MSDWSWRVTLLSTTANNLMKIETMAAGADLIRVDQPIELGGWRPARDGGPSCCDCLVSSATPSGPGDFTVKASDLMRLSSMPLASPSYPRGPYRFIDREYLIVSYESDPAAIREALPEPLA